MSVAKFNFTKKAIEAFPAPATGRAIAYDEGGPQSVPGLILRVTAADARTFQVYKWMGGKPVRVTLGRYPDLTVEMARKQAKTAIAALATGHNPNEEKRTERARSVTLEQATAAYLATRSLKESTRQDVHKAFRQVCADWLSTPLNKITPAMVQKRHREHAACSPARANLAMRYLRAIFNFAKAQYRDDAGAALLDVNPVESLSELKAWHRVGRRKTVIKAHDLGAWVNAVLALESASHRDFYLFVVMTGCRRSEAENLTWDNVDLRARTATFADTKNHTDHVLPLPGYLLEMLTQRQAGAAGRSVFADEAGRPARNFRHAQAAVTQASGVAFCLHDLRRTFSTIAESLDIPAYALKRLLNHADGADVTAGYLVIDTERLREPMERISQFILKAAGIVPSAEIVPIKRARTP